MGFSLSETASPDEVDDLEAVAGGDGGIGPGGARDDGPVMFDGDAVGLDG